MMHYNSVKKYYSVENLKEKSGSENINVFDYNRVQTITNFYEIACKGFARGLQLDCERLSEDEASEARLAFNRLVRGTKKSFFP